MKPRENEKKPALRVIRGGRYTEMSFGPVRIVVAPEESPPFPVSAVVAEEDTFLVLTAPPVIRELKEHPLKLLAQAIETPPADPGSVLVKGERSLRFLAIVHDLNQEPSWREEWIAEALQRIFKEAERRKLEALALPLLGGQYGSFKNERFVGLLRCALEQAALKYLKRLWLIVPLRLTREILEMLKSEIKG
jgi:hypothetical protein